MRPVPKTIGLFILALLLGALNFVDKEASEPGGLSLPFLVPIDADNANRIEITAATEKIVLERDEGADSWSISSPITQAADLSRIRNLLRVFRHEVAMDVRVDTGNAKEYGLDASRGIVVEIWAGRDTPEMSAIIGNAAPGGANFVRLSQDDNIYRARVGGRGRFEASASDWRNRALFEQTEANIQGVSVKPQSGPQLHLIRDESSATDAQGAPMPGPWRVDGNNSASPDSLAKLVAAIGRLRASEILAEDFDGGFSPPAAEITLIDQAGTETTLAIGTRETENGAYVRLGGQVVVYRVPGPLLPSLLKLTGGTTSSLTMYSLDPASISALIYYEGRKQIELAPNASGVWALRSPAGLPIDVKDINWALQALTRPAAVQIAEDATDRSAGLSRPRMVIEVQLQDGSNEALYIGRAFRTGTDVRFYVKRQKGDTIYEMDEPTLSRLRRAFGQG